MGIAGTAVRAACVHYSRMSLMRPRDDIRVEACRVVRAQQPPRRTLVEGEVQQRLVLLALDQLGRAAARPDRLADAAKAMRRALVPDDPFLPGRDDPGRVAADRR